MERGERRVRAICNIATKVEFLINVIPTAATCSVQLFMSKLRKMDRKYLILTYKQSGKRFFWLKRLKNHVFLFLEMRRPFLTNIFTIIHFGFLSIKGSLILNLFHFMFIVSLEDSY